MHRRHMWHTFVPVGWVSRVHKAYSPPPPPVEVVTVSRAQSRLSAASTPLPDRPGPPAEIIKEMQKKIDVQYKKYPRHDGLRMEKTPPPPPRPAPPPPERAVSLGRVRAAPSSSTPATPTTKRKIVIRAQRTPSPHEAALSTNRLKVLSAPKNILFYD